MLPKYHIFYGAIFSILIYFLVPVTILQTLLIFLSSVLIDFDHYLLYVFKKKDLNLKRAYFVFVSKTKKWLNLSSNQRQKYKRDLIIFHGIEFIILLILLSFFQRIFIFILLGVLFHLILDYIEEFYYRLSPLSKFSQIYVYISNKGKKDFY